MKKIMYAFAILMVFLPMMACSTALTRADIDPWLQDVAGDESSAVNVEGRWQDADTDPNNPFGWGRGYFEQEGNQVEGSLGDYDIEGKVSGDTVFLVLLSAGEVHYTARLEKKDDGMLRGDYFNPGDKEQEQGSPMALEQFEK
ncbi:MAG: hypothetical protein R6U41_08315 [Desulfosalsimonas sp.]|uniref:hypothetical protein n=1 Tax=Desulfosalsimonas sp. TaxID=3073848 RepID=UPI00397072A1